MRSWTIIALLSVSALYSGAGLADTFVLDPAGSRLSFAFIQANAENTGTFGKFKVELSLDPAKPAADRLDVSIDMNSLDTRDAERDEVLRSADLFDVGKHPAASFSSTSIKRTGKGRYEALGQLTIRGVSRDIRVPFTFINGRMKGGAMIRRLDFGVGQGEWESTEWVGNGVKITFDLRLAPRGKTEG